MTQKKIQQQQTGISVTQQQVYHGPHQTQPIGSAFFNNVAVESYHGFVGWASTTTANLQGPNGVSDTRTTTATTNKPVASYGTSDQISFTITYEAA